MVEMMSESILLIITNVFPFLSRVTPKERTKKEMPNAVPNSDIHFVTIFVIFVASAGSLD